jgi:hypothetical protein
MSNFRWMSLCACLFLAVESATAVDRLVPQAYPNIQSAINASSSGDVIIVSPGTYNQRLDIGGRNITIKSTLGAAATIIDPQGAGGVVITSTNAAANGWSLEGFTIRNGLDSGLYLSGVTCSVKNCVFQNNQASQGGALHIRAGASASIDGCQFLGNLANSGAFQGGALFVDGSAALVRTSSFVSNSVQRPNGGYPGGQYFQRGGAICSQSSTVTLEDCESTGNVASSNFENGGYCQNAYREFYSRGGFAYTTGGSLTLRRHQSTNDKAAVRCIATVDLCQDHTYYADARGGCVFSEASASVIIDGCQIAGSRADVVAQGGCCFYNDVYPSCFGGALFVKGSSCTVQDSVLGDCAAVRTWQGGSGGPQESSGGAIYHEAGSLALLRSSISGAAAPDRGGAIFSSSAGSVTTTDVTIEQCSSPGNGGAVCSITPASWQCTNLTLDGCSGGTSGGAIWLTGGSRTFLGCTFTNNAASGAGDRRGGAIYAEGGASLNFTDCDFTGNSVKATGNNADQSSFGGACAMFGVTPRFTRCIFTGNMSQANGTGGGWRRAYGGATADYDSDAIYTDCVFDGNKAEWTGDGSRLARGGSVWMWSSDGDFVRSTVLNSTAGPATAEALGGGVCLENVSRPGFTSCTFQSCTAQKGGAMASYSSEPYLVSTAIRDCNASVAGGGLLVDGASTPYVLAGVFERNTSPLGGAIRAEGSGTNAPFVVNTSFCGNTNPALSGTILGGEGNTVADACSTDCDGNGQDDATEIAAGAPDVDANGVLDACQLDCNANDLPDAFELGQNTVPDCNGNGRPDSCDIASGVSTDDGGNGTPDECELVSARLVPFEYPTISAAISAAASGDSIVVAPGAYYEKLSFGNKNLVFKSVGGAAVTYLDGNGQNGTIVTVNGGQGNGTIIDGFTFWYAQGGHALYIQNASPTVRNCRFLFNNVADGAALRIDSPATPRIYDCVVESNTGTNGAGLWTNTNPVLERVLFKNNVVTGVGGAARLAGGSPGFYDCQFLGNSTQGGSSDQNGGAVHATSTVNLLFVRCAFNSNLAQSQGDNADRVAMGGAVFAQNCSRSGANPPESFKECTFEANVARTSGNGGGSRRSDGGAIIDWNSDLVVTDCTFAANRCESTSTGGRMSRGGAWFGLLSDAQLLRCDFEDNLATSTSNGDAHGGAIYLEQLSNGTVDDCRFEGNAALRGGAVFLTGNSQPTIRYSDLSENSATSSGGALHASGAPALVFECELRQNQSPTGSAIYADGATGPSVFGCVLCGNPGNDVVGPWTDTQNTISDLCADCNANGVEDALDIAAGAADCDQDRVPDACQDDTDGDGAIDACDGCPSDPRKVDPGSCGCGTADGDLDGDGVANCDDGCPNDATKTAPGACGCGTPDVDSDGDGTADCSDGCPQDQAKTSPGACGCGVPDTDSDGDGAADCVDGCPGDPSKTNPGVCGCGVAEADADGDGSPDCVDGCPNDPLKIEAGSCGCGVPEADLDGDGVPDCVDNCDATPNADQADCDGDGVGDACTAPADCDSNGINDRCDIAGGAADIDDDGVLDSCELDCNTNGLPDDYELAGGLAQDCNINGQLDSCEIAGGTGSDIDGDGTLDECEVDCNNNGIIDLLEIAEGAADCDGDDILDACQDGSTLRGSLTAPWGGGAPAALIVTGVPDAVGPVTVRFEVIGDLDAVNEFATLKINGTTVAVLFGADGQACPAAPQIRQLTYSATQWNALLSAGPVAIRLEAPSTVSAADCAQSRVAILVDYQNEASDCDANGISDHCELAAGTQPDCDGDGEPDGCAVASGAVPDCNGNGVPDTCDLAGGVLLDCDGDLAPDSCAIAGGQVADCNGNGTPDACDLVNGATDCNTNGIIDSCDVAAGTSQDVDSNGVPDECKADCNANALPDAWEVSTGLVPDCNANGQPDSCDVDDGAADCNGNGIPDTCDISSASSNDVNADGRPDECEADCNGNGIPDRYEVTQGLVPDCNGNGLPDGCDLAAGAPDCDANGIIDSCDVVNGAVDENDNFVPDLCEISAGDFDLDGFIGGGDLGILLSLWGLAGPPIGDFNGDGVIGGADLAELISRWSPEP